MKHITRLLIALLFTFSLSADDEEFQNMLLNEKATAIYVKKVYLKGNYKKRISLLKKKIDLAKKKNVSKAKISVLEKALAKDLLWKEYRNVSLELISSFNELGKYDFETHENLWRKQVKIVHSFKKNTGQEFPKSFARGVRIVKKKLQ